jgi:hypothetical protein
MKQFNSSISLIKIFDQTGQKVFVPSGRMVFEAELAKIRQRQANIP